MLPRVLIFSSLFPSDVAPTSGTFIRERMFRVGRLVPIVVVAPQVYSPFDWIVRLFRKTFRPTAALHETVDGVEIFRPRVFSFPGVLKELDGFFMWLGTRRCVDKIVREFKPTCIDAHFVYPDGFAASKLAQAHNLPLVITIRGSKDEWLIGTSRERFLTEALQRATKLISVSSALKKDVAVRLGQPESKCIVIGNGVDLDKFGVVDKFEARKKLGLNPNAKVVISVGGLIDRKGFHRIIPLLAALKVKFPTLVYLIVGGGTSHADKLEELKRLARDCNVDDIVKFCGPQLPKDLKWFYGASDVFALATEHEGWANVFLEAMACGLPVITTDVGGNSEVVCNENLGSITKYFDAPMFSTAIEAALLRNWDSAQIVEYAMKNKWDNRVDQVIDVLSTLSATVGVSQPIQAVITDQKGS